ncbi:MAG: hypothetical protein ACLFQV_11025 [Vulcanimicrobiota bacterium]
MKNEKFEPLFEESKARLYQKERGVEIEHDLAKEKLTASLAVTVFYCFLVLVFVLVGFLYYNNLVGFHYHFKRYFYLTLINMLIMASFFQVYRGFSLIFKVPGAVEKIERFNNKLTVTRRVNSKKEDWAVDLNKIDSIENNEKYKKSYWHLLANPTVRNLFETGSGALVIRIDSRNAIHICAGLTEEERKKILELIFE